MGKSQPGILHVRGRHDLHITISADLTYAQTLLSILTGYVDQVLAVRRDGRFVGIAGAGHASDPHVS